MHYLLYKYHSGYKYNGTLNDNCSIYEFRPHPFDLYADWERSRNLSTSIFRFYISLLTFGKTVYLCILNKNGGVIMHSAYIIPRNIKYAFLNKGEYSIGPCNTPEVYRGQGLYPYMLSYITQRNADATYYVFIREDNVASIKGAKKAGFKQCRERIKSTKVLKIFRLMKEKNNNE